MKRIALSLLLFLGWCAVMQTEAREYKVEDIPLVHLQDRTRYVSNPDGILSNDAVAVMDTILYGLERETGIQTLVVAVEQIEGGDCFDFAYQLGSKNGVGEKGKDNGLVILLVTGERCIQFATGYGLEGDLPDAICKRIQQRYMNKAFSQGKWDEGMVAGIQAVRRQLNHTERIAGPGKQEEGGDGLLVAILLICFVGVPFLLWYTVRQRTKCPNCHKHTLKQLSVRTIARIGNTRTEEIVYRCSNCGYTHRRQRKVKEQDDFHDRGGNGGPFMGGPFMGGGFGSGGGGGFGGGSFGDGSFGGGGAGSKF